MVRRSTWIILIVFIILLGALLIFQRGQDAASSEDQATSVSNFDSIETVESLFQVPPGEVIIRLEVEDNDGKRSPSCLWTQP